jgi:anti-anti-sigma factor
MHDAARSPHQIQDLGTCQVVSARGPIDVGTAHALTAAADAAIRRAAELVVLDLSDVTLLDAAGLRALLGAAAHATAAGVRLVIVPAPPRVHAAVVLAGVEGDLPFAVVRGERPERIVA